MPYFCSLKDYVEAARTAAVNQEIKRVLTEVLLKVTAAETVIVLLFNFFML